MAVFWGRERYVSILWRYLERNLVANQGIISEVRLSRVEAKSHASTSRWCPQIVCGGAVMCARCALLTCGTYGCVLNGGWRVGKGAGSATREAKSADKRKDKKS